MPLHWKPINLLNVPASSWDFRQRPSSAGSWLWGRHTAHVSKLCKVINYNLYSVGKIRRFLDKRSTEKLIAGAITSRLDYCNSLLYGIPKAHLNKLQYCQNNAARIVSLRRKFDHTSPVLTDIHWLPVEKRIEFKLLTLTYKAINGEAPFYLSELLSPYKPTRTLRSENQHLLQCPKYRLERFGRRSFEVAAPTLWNSLPVNIKISASCDIFKSRLKIYLFSPAYGQSWMFYGPMLYHVMVVCYP